MRAAWTAASRAEEVRNAAREWREANAIDDATLAAIEKEYPDARVRLAAAWKVAVFLLVTVAYGALFAAVSQVVRGQAEILCYLTAAALAVATERLRGSRLSGSGADAATAFGSAAFLVAAGNQTLIGAISRSPNIQLTLFLLLPALPFAAACARWGYSIFAFFAAGSFFLFLGRFDGGRWLWAVLGAALAAVSARFLDRVSLAPPHRRAFGWTLAAGTTALYAAINLFSLEKRTIEFIADFRNTPPPPTRAATLAAIVGTVVVPFLLLAWGLRTRRRLVLDLGLGFAALSIATFVWKLELRPVWAALLLGGIAAVLGALAIHRRLRAASRREIGGFTAEPLFGGGAGPETIHTVAAAAAFSPAAASAGPGPRDEFEGGGGRYGGGGASGKV